MVTKCPYCQLTTGGEHEPDCPLHPTQVHMRALKESLFSGLDELESVLYVDATPDEDYPLRILKAYRENCNQKWSDTTSGEEPKSLLLKKMNKDNEKRAEILDRAIAVLESAKGRQNE